MPLAIPFNFFPTYTNFIKFSKKRQQYLYDVLTIWRPDVNTALVSCSSKSTNSCTQPTNVKHKTDDDGGYDDDEDSDDDDDDDDDSGGGAVGSGSGSGSGSCSSNGSGCGCCGSSSSSSSSSKYNFVTIIGNFYKERARKNALTRHPYCLSVHPTANIS